METPVSIVTVTRGNRVGFLSVLARNIKKQSWKNILEWVVVDGSQTDTERERLRNNIDVSRLLIPIRVFDDHPCGHNIGMLRNIGNGACDGDVIVWMDDDDFYPACYVEHVVETLASNKCNAIVAGCAETYVYDLRWNLFVRAKPNAKNHTCNNCLAYRKEYLKNHRYDDHAAFDEESAFLGMPNNSLEATVPIAQLDPAKSVIHLVHHDNIVEKTRVVLSALYDVPYCAVKTTKRVQNCIDCTTLGAYYKLLGDKPDCEYDIVYYCGLWSPRWDPEDTDLGGSEQAVKYLSHEWAKRDLRVAVYSEVPNKKWGGVDYYPVEKFNPWQKFKTLILWRNHGVMPFVPCANTIVAERLLIDLHDNCKNTSAAVHSLLERYNRAGAGARARNGIVMCKSNFHYRDLLAHLGMQEDTNSLDHRIIMNGIQIERFAKQLDPYDGKRSQYRFCYASCYTRGLHIILEHLWPIILQMEPRAELHLYYGMNLVSPKNAEFLQGHINRARNVCNHGRCPIEMVAREKHLSTFQLYTTETPSEIDCISVRESLVAGCIPIMLNMGVFAERDGVHIELGTNVRETAIEIARLMNDPEECNRIRERLYSSKTIRSWSEVADEWLRWT